MRYILTKLIRRRSETVEREKKIYMKTVYNKTYKRLENTVKTYVFEHLFYCCFLFLAPWFDVSLDSPTELKSATEGISTMALIVGLILAGLVGGVIGIWRKLKVGLSIH